MRSWCVVEDEFHNAQQFSRLVWKALAYILDQNSYQFLRFLVFDFHQALFHGPPRCPEPVAYAHQGSVLSDEHISEL